MADFTDDSLLFTPNGPLKGLDAIRGLFVEMFEEFGEPGMSFEMLRQGVEGDCACIVWKAETADNVYEIGTDSFVVRAGKIADQSFCGKIVPKG
ncbi:MAG: nuclear transport factor 2 family protein [Gemmatimonadales bacterium]|jgi:ketosteroid isomerase-like protein